jgi:hypothetical protein
MFLLAVSLIQRRHRPMLEGVMLQISGPDVTHISGLASALTYRAVMRLTCSSIGGRQVVYQLNFLSGLPRQLHLRHAHAHVRQPPVKLDCRKTIRYKNEVPQTSKT